ncbi:MAG: MMPL family transporter [Planctomycetales bacterium]|nr:MMPL family transporter [Planctomycetales bacterium]
MATQHLENNIKDWLPSDFPETKDLEWFGKHFIGERFILVTWPGCTEVDQRYQLFDKKLESEIPPTDEEIAKYSPEQLAHERTRQMGDRLGLFSTGNYYENWGGLGEKWLQGHGGQWYFITPSGELREWDGDSNLGDFVVRSIKKRTGGEVATGKLIATVGESIPGVPNPYHADPRKITARFFKTIRSGPDMLGELAYENGPLWPRTSDVADEDKPRVARQTAYERLTGTLFGPAIHQGFSWEAHDFLAALPPATTEALPSDWEERFESFVDRLVENQYGGDREKLVQASSDQQTEHWDVLFTKLRVDPPPRQTCFIVTMSAAGKRDLARVIGRPILGKPPGRILDLAINECGITADDLKMGGPPVDNIAIDEEGTITLVRLVGYSAVIGISLSLLCFRSIKVTIMVFFVGGVSAVASLAIVFWSGSVPGMEHLSSVDAVLMSMPALVYVLGLSGAVHIVNYYREAVEEKGVAGAAERAIGHAWGPCTLAAFTTALGLISLYSSNLMPIKKFGLFSALGVMATLSLLFCYLPAALTIWPFITKKRESEEGGVAKAIENMWLATGRWIIGNHWLVAASCTVLMIVVGVGLKKIRTEVQLLKLFDADSKIISDYHWLEGNLGKLVPMELVVSVKPEVIRPSLQQLKAMADKNPRAFDEAAFQLTVLERMQLVNRIQKVCEREFGEVGRDVIGKGMSAATFVSDLPGVTDFSTRGAFNSQLERQLNVLPTDYVRTDTRNELWRISERLGALNDVDYGVFVHEQKVAVEPVLTAYRFRDKILRDLSAAAPNGAVAGKKILFLGFPLGENTKANGEVAASTARESESEEHEIDQTRIFGETLRELIKEVRCATGAVDPSIPHPEGLPPLESLVGAWADCVVLLKDDPSYDLDAISSSSKLFIDARDHKFELGKSLTAAERDEPIQVVYTGVVPVVYKAQRTLLNSLVESIGLAFVMIAAVMMVLLRDWKRRLSPFNTINVSAGMTSMLPNVFPVVLIFGAMGHLGMKIDIGTMMCASVAMGVAVDDTIHFLTWFRIGLREGMTRNEALLEAYRRVATAMTQTTLIGGLGLAVFALSTFTPTQRFGVMMVTLLVAALAGDLILLPALLAGPLGRFFMVEKDESQAEKKTETELAIVSVDASEHEDIEDSTVAEGGETRHSAARRKSGDIVRSDKGHHWPWH